MASFKEMTRDGTLKRADAMQAKLDDIHEEPGFNLRHEGQELEASIDALADFIEGGGIYPPLEVRPRAEGGVWVVDGHRRRRALLRCAERGVPLASPKDGIIWVHIRSFEGNDADRVARIITSAEGKALSQLEVALGFKRLTAFGWTPADIAKRVCKTEVHVRNLLGLANADSDVHAMVKRGEVSGSVAAKTLRQVGDKAGAVLSAALADAKAQGKTKVMPKAVIAKPAKANDEPMPFVERLRWHDATTKKPDSDTSVLVWVDDDWAAGYWDDDQAAWISCAGGNKITHAPVTHWAEPQGPGEPKP